MIEAALDRDASAEFTMRELMQAMGHSSISITMDRYGKLLPGGGERMAASYQALWDRADTAARLGALSD